MIRRRTRTPDVSGSRLPNGGWHLRIGMRLASPNANHNGHWSTRHRERQAWADAIESALILAADVRTHAAYRKLIGTEAPKVRMRLRVIREVPTARNFIRDRDNLVFSSKRLRDALKGHGLIYDDSMKWLEFPDPTQEVSEDGQYWTVITIEPAQQEV